MVIGDFYGDPAVAIVDQQERFVLMGGCGMIIYHVTEPFDPYRYETQTRQWVELCRERGNEWWIEEITQESDDVFHVTVDPNCNHAGVYALTLPGLALRKLR